MSLNLTQITLDNAFKFLPNATTVSLTRNGTNIATGIDARIGTVNYQAQQFLNGLGINSKQRSWLLRAATVTNGTVLDGDFIVDTSDNTWRVVSSTLEQQDTVFRCLCVLQRGV